MIEDFVYVLNNGIKTTVGEYLPSVPLLQQINDPAFQPKAYEWHSGGQVFTRLIDDCETLTAYLLADGRGIIVLQDAEAYGPDNIVILDPDNKIRQRVTNPYRSSRFFANGDQFWFDGISIEPTEVLLNIQVKRKLSTRSHDAVPIYEAAYEPESMKLLGLEWKPWT